MSQLKNKSEINRKAASFLHDKGLYPSVIHCSYYCCYQFMIDILINKLRISNLELIKIGKDEEKGSHEVTINQIAKQLSKNYLISRKFSSDINLLKRNRHKADYKDELIDYKLSQESIDLCDSVLKNLNTI